jgi:IS30 family transposase
MVSYRHLTAEERERIAALQAEGQSVRASAQALGRSPATVSRELRRIALASGVRRPAIAEGSCLLRRQRLVVLKHHPALADYVTDRAAEGWTPEQLSDRLKRGLERGLLCVSTETIYAWILRPAQRTATRWRDLPRGKAKPGRRGARDSKDRIKDKVHLSERSASAVARAERGHRGANLVIWKRARPVLVLHERKTRLTPWPFYWARPLPRPSRS